MPPPDDCSGYLQVRLDPDRIALFRVPKANTVFDNSHLKKTSTFAGQTFDSKTFSINVIGTSIGLFLGDNPFSSALNAGQIRYDRSGGATFVVWPIDMPIAQRTLLFAFARLRGWNILRGQ